MTNELTQLGLQELYAFQEATGCDTAAQFMAQSELNGAIAIDETGEVFTGYDTHEQEYSQTNKLREFDEPMQFASKADKIALADKMIARWEAYKREAI